MSHLHGELLQASTPVDEIENQQTGRHKTGERPKVPESGINFVELLKQEEENDV